MHRAALTDARHAAFLVQVTSAQWRGTAAWGPSPLASPSARAQARFMTTYDDIAKLQAQIDDLQAQQVDLRKQLAKA